MHLLKKFIFVWCCDLSGKYLAKKKNLKATFQKVTLVAIGGFLALKIQ